MGYGGEVPKSYYFTNDDISVDMQSLHIPRSSKKHLEFEISVNKCQIRFGSFKYFLQQSAEV